VKRILRTLYFALLCLPGALSAGETREWTSTVGTTVEARLVEETAGGEVTLELANGSRIDLRMDQLSQKDREYIARVSQEAAMSLKILFIGNSYTGQVRRMVSALVKASPYANSKVQFISPGGKTLAFHLSQEKTMDLIREGDWDFVVLQDQSQTPAVFPDTFMDAAKGIDAIIDESGAQTVFYETWGRRDGDKRNPERFPDYDSMQKALSNSYKKAARKCDARLAPVGTAWAIVRDRYPSLGRELYAKDGSHPADAGAFLAACVFYATFLGGDPSEVDFDGGLSAENVEAIYQAVAKAVSN